MATVYLPLGYPQVSGTFETIVYQGTVVRVYQNVTDPRTDAQVFRRYLMRDLTKMRAVAGEYPKAAWKIQFGRLWGTVINQICLGNAEGYWDAAWNEWETMSQAERDYLNENVPFLATWLEPGRVWWALYRTLWQWSDAHGENVFHMPAISASDPDPGWLWWSSGLTAYDLQAYADTVTWWDDRAQAFIFSGSWSSWNGTGPRDGTLRQGSTVGGYVEVLPKFSNARLWYAKNTDTGDIEVYYGGAVQQTIATNGALAWQQVYDVGRVRADQKPLRFRHGGPAGKLIDIDGVELWTVYKGEDLELVGSGWQMVAKAVPAGDYYHFLDGVGVVNYFFNFVGRYCKVYFPVGPVYTTFAFFVDGALAGSYNAYSTQEYMERFIVLGPFRRTLHRVEVKAYNGKLAVDRVEVRNYKADL